MEKMINSRMLLKEVKRLQEYFQKYTAAEIHLICRGLELNTNFLLTEKKIIEKLDETIKKQKET